MITTFVPPRAKRLLFAFGAHDDKDLWDHCSDAQRSAMWNADLVLLHPRDAEPLEGGSFLLFGVAKLIGYATVTADGALARLQRLFPDASAMEGDGPWGQGAVRLTVRDATFVRLGAER